MGSSCRRWSKAAATFGCLRHKANSGERLDFENKHVVGQCKLTKNLSLEKLTQLAEEMDVVGHHTDRLGVVCTKVRRGRGKESPMLITMTRRQFMDWFDMTEGGNDGRDCAEPGVAAVEAG